MASVDSLDFYLCVLKPVTVLSARVNGAPSDPYMSIDFDAGSTGTVTTVGTSGAPVAGNTVWFGSTDGDQERGTARLRYWSPSNGSGTAGSLSIAETDDTGPAIQDDDFITVKLEWRLWAIAPRLVQAGTEVEYYEDYDIGWIDQTTNWRPIAVAGPPAVEFGRGPVQVSFVGDRSFALASGASITNYLWTAHGSVEGTSASQGTEGSPVTFTWNSPGQYLVSLQVTDSNGRHHTAYTFVFIVDPSDPDAGSGAYTQFDAYNDSHDFFRGGGECSFTVRGVADVTEFPREAMVVHAADGSQTTATGTWPFRSNVLGVYYIVGDTIRQNSVSNTTSFRAQTIDGLMKNLSMHATSLRDERGPKDWTMASDITVDRAASFQMIWRSTLASMTPVVRLNYDAEIKRQDFAPTNLYAQLQNELIKDAWGQLVSSHQSVLHLARDYQLMTTTEQAAVTTRKLLHKGIWMDPLDIEERPDYAWPVRKVKMSGIYYPGDQAEVKAMFSEAPGDVHKAFGREDAPGRLIVTTQDDLNTRCGYALARQNYRWHTVRGRFVNDGSFTVAPQEIFPAAIEGTDNNRGLAWTPDLIPRRMRRTYDHAGGYYVNEVEFEPSTTGPAGATITIETPTETPTKPIHDPEPEVPWEDPILPQAGAAVASDGAMGVYYTNTKGATWERRVNGLYAGATGTSQLFFQDLIWDPWWFTPDRKATSDPEQVILFGCGPGFIVKSDDAAKNWVDYTTYLGDPPNSFADDPAPTIADAEVIQIHGDIHNIDTFYALVRWQNATGNYRGWIAKTTDNLLSWTWQNIGTSTADGTWVNAEVVASGGLPGGTVTNPDYIEQRDSLYAHMNDASYIDVQFCGGVTFPGTDVNIRWRAKMDAPGNGPFEARVHWYDEATGVSDLHWFTAGVDPTDGTAYEYEVTDDLNGSAKSRLRIRMTGFVFPNPGSDYDGYLDYFQVKASDIGCAGSGQEVRPLAMDLDTQDGSRLYITVFNVTTGNLELWVYNSSLTKIRDYTFEPASDAEVTQRTKYIFPHTPHYPGTTSFGDYVYVAGRWGTGTAQHLHLSTDAGVSFAGIGDASWGANRVGGFRPDEETAGQTLYAFLNGTPALWRTQDAGGAWSNLGSNPFNVEFEAVSRHWGGSGDFLIGANAAGAVQGAWLDSPYTDAWYDATGPAGDRLPGAGDGGTGITSIIWI